LNRVRKKGILTYYIDLYPAITKQKFIEIYASGIAKNLTGKIERIIQILKKLIPFLIPKVEQKGKPNSSFLMINLRKVYRFSSKIYLCL